MTEPVDIAQYLRNLLHPKLSAEEKRFDALVSELRDWPIAAVIDALVAAFDTDVLDELIAELGALVTQCRAEQAWLREHGNAE